MENLTGQQFNSPIENSDQNVQWLTVREVIKLFPFYSIARLRAAVNRNEIPAYKIGRSWMFIESEVRLAISEMRNH